MTKILRWVSCGAVAVLAACGAPQPGPRPEALCQRVIVDVPPNVYDAAELGFGEPLVDLSGVGAAAYCLGDAAVDGMRFAGLAPRPDPIMRALGPEAAPAAQAPDQWHVTKVQAQPAWSVSRGAGATIVVIDTGVDCTHADLSRRCVGGSDPVGGRPQGPGRQGDGHGHGTHVAGTAVSIAPDASIESCRALDNGGNGYLSDIAWCVLSAARGGAVISMSLGGPNSDRALDDAVRQAVVSGAYVVAARGNDGDQDPLYPACADGVVGVAATTRADARADWSSYGPCTDVAAPGEGITAAKAGGGYVPMSGTSMATPIVSGIAALLVAMNARDGLTALLSGMDAVSDRSIPGRVNAQQSVRLAVPGGPLPTVTPGPTLAPPPTRTPYNPYPEPETTGTPTVPPAPPTRTPTATRVWTPTATPTVAWNSCAEVGLKEIEVRGLFRTMKVCQGRPR